MKYYLKILLQHYAMGLIVSITIIWKLQNGLSLSTAVFTESIVLLATALSDLPAGFIANAINNKRSLIIGAALHLLAVTLLAIGRSLPVFVASALAMGVAWAFISGADEAYIHDDFIADKSDYKKVFATVNAVDEAATILGMLTASLCMYVKFGLRDLFVAAAVVLAVHLLYSIFFLPSSVKTVDTHTSSTKLFNATLLKNKAVLTIMPAMLAFGVLYEAGRALWQPHMQQIGINVADFGLIFAGLKLASIGGSVVARHKDFHISHLLVVFAVMLASLLIFGSSAKVVSIAGLCVYLFMENYFRIFMSTTMNRLIHRNRAAVLSFGSVIKNASGALIVGGASVLVRFSIFYALLMIVLVKLPAIYYLVRRQAEPNTIA
ncbi:MAG TPA: MFS transporter [Candidatus Saccharimonadales bacterium]